jgi:stalled ribosome alternative rescue factor ArfA
MTMIRIFKHLPFLAIISVSFAETIPNLNEIEKSQPVDNSPQVYHPRHRWEISYIARKWDYSETTANKTLMAESGLLQGVRASYYRPLGHSLFFIKPAVSYIGGKTEYKGATWEGEGLHSEDRHVIADADLQVGAHKRLGNNVFGSLGVSAYFRRLIHPRTKSKGSYRREVDYKTVGFHLSSTYHRNNLFITPIIRYDHLLEGKARAFLGKANSDYPNLKLEQKRKSGNKGKSNSSGRVRNAGKSSSKSYSARA